MAEYKTLLFATDFSEGASKAADHARSLASLCKARLHLLHVITELTDKRRRRLPAEVVNTFVREVETHALEDMHAFRDKYFADAAEAGYEVTTDVVIGSGFQEILKQAEIIGADLIVMGTHGRTGLEKVLVGSTAERVVRQSIIPVLTIRE
ncbi:universal stress protein [Marinospirillum alkaliphilum]|uniref:Universal stress protein n=1 Tax=Marinospirillum alkaliphilum DSM 21637 TaxID=1122209 RepID=A0A1K1ZII2_9GAMM|nr:universal stress protein [Marinospirillum alkaliphilum]SFX73317.1 Nucleotide-binding universal stress protein, UspA family [Marinospirillum alkaliphilum DSM 21637]